MLNDKTVLHPGNTASLTGSLQEIMTATNPGMFDRREYYKEKGVYYELRATTLQITSFRTNPVKDLLYRLRNRMGEVYTTSLPAKESGIVSAMILGDKSLLDIDIRQLYQESGIGHLLAISGLHVCDSVHGTDPFFQTYPAFPNASLFLPVSDWFLHTDR